MSQNPAKVNPELAKAQFQEDYQLMMDNHLPEHYGWQVTPEFDNLLLYVDLWATDENFVRLDDYHLKLDMSYYRTWPPGATYINPETKAFDPTKDLKWLPVKASNPPGIDIGYHKEHKLTDGNIRQLVCNSMTLEYYLSNHNPTPEQKWNPEKNTLSSTLLALQLMLRKPYYGGRST